jgi:hypothetical protein
MYGWEVAAELIETVHRGAKVATVGNPQIIELLEALLAYEKTGDEEARKTARRVLGLVLHGDVTKAATRVRISVADES